MRVVEKDAHKKIGHEYVFRPSQNVRNYKFKAPYSHHVERIEVKKNYRESSGRVKLGLPNFYTSGHKSGKAGTGFGTCFGSIAYMPHFDAAKEQEDKQKKI